MMKNKTDQTSKLAKVGGTNKTSRITKVSGTTKISGTTKVADPIFSVVLAVHNEAENLERCLKSVEKVADEIIVVDGESSDETVKIARRLGAKVIETSNKPIFHINKQMAIDAARGKLILQLDADEVVDAGMLQFLQNLKAKMMGKAGGTGKDESTTEVGMATKVAGKNEPLEYAAWWLKRKNLFIWRWLKKGGQYPDPVIRLFVKGKARLPQKSVHEQMEVDGKIGWAEGHLMHYSNPSFSDYMRKFNTYTDLTASDLFAKKYTLNFQHTLEAFLLQPLVTFLKIFVRHKGFVDGLAGFIFALMSALHHPVAYLKLWEKYQLEKT